MPVLIQMVSFALSGTVFMKSLQLFPGTLTRQDITTVFKEGVIAGYLKWSLNDYTWLAYPLIIFGTAYLSMYFKPVFTIAVAVLNIGILITGVLCLYAGFKKSTASERNKILWLLWGILTYSFVATIGITIDLFNNENTQIVRLIITSLLATALTLSMIMCLFFSDTFDTGTIIKRTLVDGSIFTLIIILYNTIEHYFLHWLSEELHLSDVLISSFLSGIFVMIFSPIHHRLMNFLGKKIRKHPAEHTIV